LAAAVLLFTFATASGAQATNVVCDRCVNNSDLANSSVTSEKILDGSVKSIDLATSAVKTANINNRSVTFGKLATGVRDALDGAIANLTRTAVEGSDLSVAEANCPSSRIAVSASCFCDDDSGTNNNGVLFACVVEGNGAVAACFDEAGTFNPVLPSPVAIVQAICLGAETTDGTPWDPAPEGSASLAARAGAVDARAAAHKAQDDALAARVSELRTKTAAHRERLQD
jgi:hypothetical protein